MDFWQIVLDWLKNLFGLDLLLGAMEAGEPIPAQAYLNLIFSKIFPFFQAIVSKRRKWKLCFFQLIDGILDDFICF